MTVTHIVRLFRTTIGDVGDKSFPIIADDDADAVVQAREILSAHFIGTTAAKLKPTQAIVYLFDGDGSTAVHRLACFSANDIRSMPLTVDPKGQIKRA